MATEYRNIHGRQWGRGIRPYLLLPKFVCVGIFLGGLVSLMLLELLRPPPRTPAAWAEHADRIRRAYTLVIVPALVGVLLMGLLLASTHFKAFIRMRWFKVKMVTVAVFVPTLHTFMQNRSRALRAAVIDAPDPAAAGAIRQQLVWGTCAVLIFAFCIIVLGRIKPRLGQDYARTFSKPEDTT